ncbi:hypothetical protein MEQU1_002505 [Malassezia equina]|uniref:PCI domain-containing protein n=1 Tax=Malassezia equina TaxID=1381935 RepID=A0AAF0IZD2_9BASI|nr:hypothetical protein MEQU1_002505 [Malassezia equina]
MSDEEFMMEDTLDDEEDEEEEEDADALVENKYYNAKGTSALLTQGIKGSQPEKAICELQEIIDLEGSKSEWGFKALKQQMKIQTSLGRYDQALTVYRRLFEYMHSFITQNYAEKTIITLLDYVTASAAVSPDHLQAFYDAPKELAPKPLYERALQNLRETEFAKGMLDSQGQGTTFLELLCMEIQMYDNMGKADMVKVDFFQAFNNYDEAGSCQRVIVLKYLVLAHILMGSGINPFDSQETKPYKDDVDMMPLVALLEAYESHDIHKAESIIREFGEALQRDELIGTHLPDVLHELRIQYIQEYVKPYRTVRLEQLAQQIVDCAQTI